MTIVTFGDKISRPKHLLVAGKKQQNTEKYVRLTFETET